MGTYSSRWRKIEFRSRFLDIFRLRCGNRSSLPRRQVSGDGTHQSRRTCQSSIVKFTGAVFSSTRHIPDSDSGGDVTVSALTDKTSLWDTKRLPATVSTRVLAFQSTFVEFHREELDQNRTVWRFPPISFCTRKCCHTGHNIVAELTRLAILSWQNCNPRQFRRAIPEECEQDADGRVHMLCQHRISARLPCCGNSLPVCRGWVTALQNRRTIKQRRTRRLKRELLFS